MYTTALFIAKNWKQPQSTEIVKHKWIVVYSDTRVPYNHENVWNTTICNHMNGSHKHVKQSNIDTI